MTTTAKGIDWREIARATCLDVDWKPIAKSALGSAFLAGLVGGALHMLGKAIEADMRTQADREAPAALPVFDESELPSEPTEAAADDESEAVAENLDEKAVEAAALLGVTVDASEDEIRSALRARFGSSRLHPDHGGDGEEAARVIAAKNLLIERVRAHR
jgi:hypothetical protein